MKAIVLKPGTKNVELKTDWPEPSLQTPTQAKVRIRQVGICGTDREEVSGGRADAPKGENQLVIGHEMFGVIEEIGKGVKKLRPGDPVVITVRRGCGQCQPCLNGCFDMCETGLYTERGIKERHGYECEKVVEEEEFMVPVPKSIEHIAVLTEPTTVVEKAIDEASKIQVSRLPGETNPEKWLQDKNILVAGLGPIGLLAAMILSLRGAKVTGMDIVDPNSVRPQILQEMGGAYKKSDQILEHESKFDMIVEAAGIAKLDFDLIHVLANNGVYVLTGVPGDDRPLNVDAGNIMKQLVLKNQVIVGSVNAGNIHFKRALQDLEAAEKKWKGVMEKLITHRVKAEEYDKVLFKHEPDEIKAIIEWS
ncbi:MAG: alcohol dehydrogenase [Chlamydiae bacterium CG10_big_fil_rev_8_21_14_0_10_35_9]|nr:MAG: alcohol dehydrogenase [Chlamydiae bacterium CG10_big_fil_rev_8_21_14_0_10_35_9]